MSNKKNIDRLFQEKFKDFEVKPNEAIWGNIQDKINAGSKKKTRAIPLWLKISGIAASLLLLLTLGNIIYKSNTSVSPSNEVVDTKNNNNQPKNNTEQIVNDGNSSNKQLPNNNTSVATSNAEEEQNNGSINQNGSTNLNTPNKTSVATNNKLNNKTPNTTVLNNKVSNNVVTNRDNIINNNKSVNTNQATVINTSEENKTSNNSPTDVDNIVQNTIASVKNNLTTAAKNNNAISSSEKNKALNDAINTSEEKLNNNQTTTDIANNTENKDLEKTNATEELVNTQSIEDAIAESKDLNEKEKEEVTNRWNVYANIAPVYYNSLGKGSHIHDQFIDNPKSGEINTSYGVTVGYALDNKLTVRTGLNKLNLSYDTDNVIVYDNVMSSTGNAALRNIAFKSNTTGDNISLLSASTLNIIQTSSLVGSNLNAAISQRLSYYEIPVELEYNLLNSKFGISVIGGFSSFISDGNEIVSEIAGQKTEIGEAKNINSFSFSTNFGLGFDYRFFDAFELKLEPTFKYQLNAFNNTSGNFRPYIIGIYTGLSYKF